MIANSFFMMGALVCSVLIFALLCASTTNAQTSSYVFPVPSKNYTYVIPFAPGAGSGIVGDIQTAAMNVMYGVAANASSNTKASGYGKTVYIPGNGGAQAWANMKTQPLDGSIVTMINTPHIIAQPYSLAGANFTLDDMTVVYIHSYTPVVAVVASKSNITSWQAFMNLVESNPGRIVTAGAGPWTIGHLASLVIMQQTGTNWTFNTTYTAATSQTAVLTGEITLLWTSPSAVLGDSRFRMLAVSSEAGFPQMPDVPTFRDVGVNYVDGTYRGIGVPKSTPPALCQAISDAYHKLNIQQSYYMPLIQQGYVMTFFKYGDSVNNFLANKNATYFQVMFPPPPMQPVPQLQVVDSKTVTAMIALSCFGILLTILTSLVLAVYRTHPVFLAASVPFCCVMLVGFLLGFISVIILALNPQAYPSISVDSMDYICRSFPWVFGCSFTLLFGALFAKTWRLVCIFLNRDLKVSSSVSNKSIARNVCLLLVIENIFHAVWAIVNPLKYEPVFLNSNTFINTCTSPNLYVWMGVMFFTKLGLLLFGIALAIKTRNIESQFNESKSIGFCMYNILFCSLIAVPLILNLQGMPSLRLLVSVLAIFICLCMCLVALFLPKIVLIYGDAGLLNIKYRGKGSSRALDGRHRNNNTKMSSESRTNSSNSRTKRAPSNISRNNLQTTNMSTTNLHAATDVIRNLREESTTLDINESRVINPNINNNNNNNNNMNSVNNTNDGYVSVPMTSMTVGVVREDDIITTTSVNTTTATTTMITIATTSTTSPNVKESQPVISEGLI